jgi:hypothetical protein
MMRRAHNADPTDPPFEAGFLMVPMADNDSLWSEPVVVDLGSSP